jgi:hypothetical protein
MRAFSTRLAVSCFKEYSSLTASVSTDLHTRANRIVLRKQNPGGTDRHAKRSAALLQRHACEKARMQRQRHACKKARMQRQRQACKKVCSSSAEAHVQKGTHAEAEARMQKGLQLFCRGLFLAEGSSCKQSSLPQKATCSRNRCRFVSIQHSPGRHVTTLVQVEMLGPENSANLRGTSTGKHPSQRVAMSSGFIFFLQFVYCVET